MDWVLGALVALWTAYEAVQDWKLAPGLRALAEDAERARSRERARRG